MAKMQKGFGWKKGVGVQHESPAHPKSEGIYHHVHTPHTHSSEYAADAHIHPVQETFPAGRRYGGSEGAGKKMGGSEGDGLHGKMHKRSK